MRVTNKRMIQIVTKGTCACVMACALTMSGAVAGTIMPQVEAEQTVGSWVYESEYANYYYTDANGWLYRAEDMDMDYCELISIPSTTTGEVSIPRSITVDGKQWAVKKADGFQLPEGITEKVLWVYEEAAKMYYYTDANGWKYSVSSLEDSMCYLESIPDNAEGEFSFVSAAKIGDVEWPVALSAQFQLPAGITSVVAPRGTDVSEQFFAKANSNLVVHGYTDDEIMTKAKKMGIKLDYVNVITDKQGVGYCIIEQFDLYAPNEVEVYQYSKKSGKVIIPKSIKINGTTYSVVSIQNEAFKKATKLTSITIPKTVTMIGDSAFQGCTALTTVKMADSVNYMGQNVFSGCSKLKKVTLSKKLATIPVGTFNKCKNLTSVTIPNSVSYIGQKAFYGCSKLKKITLGTKVTDIDVSAFAKCTKLQSVTVKSKVLCSIGKEAFNGDKSLKTITLKTTKLTKSSIGKNALKGTKKKMVVKVPSKKVKAYKKFMQKYGNKTVVVKKG